MGNIKGTFFLNTVKALRALGEGAEGVVPREVRHYLRDRILPSSWYPEEHHVALMRALIRITPPTGRDPWEHFGELSAGRDMVSIYRALLREGDPEATLARLGTLWSLGHDTGTLRTELLEPGRGQLVLRDYTLIDADFCRLNTSFFTTALRLAGAREPALQHTRCRCRGDDVCAWEARWSR